MKSSEIDLKDWIEGCKKNDRTCQKNIYEMLYSPMMSVCLRYAEDRQEASDILQDAFLKVFEKIRLYNDEGSFEGWVRRIIVNTCLDAIRKKKKEILSDDTALFQSSETTEDDTEANPYDGIDVNDVVDAMQKLSPMYQAVFNMYVMDGMTHQEIADELYISVNTVKTQKKIAYAKLKTKLSPALHTVVLCL